MKQTITRTTLVACLITSGTLFAAGAPVENQFQNGQPADANAVNANFQELANRISDAAIVVNADTYKHTHATKTFSVKFTDGNTVVTPNFDKEVRTYNRTVANQVTIVRERSRAGVLVRYDELTRTIGANVDTVWTQRKISSVAAGSLTGNTTTITLPTGMVVRKAQMTVGQSWGSAGDSSKVATPVLPGEPIAGSFVDTRSLLEVVPTLVLNNGASYNDCIKISNKRLAHIGGSSQRISWSCAGHGLVKRVLMSPRVTTVNDVAGAVTSVSFVYQGQVMELESFTP